MKETRTRQDVRDMDTLGNNVRRLIGLHGLTAMQAASLIGLSAQAMSELSKRKNPRKDTVEKIANFFDIGYNRLWDQPFEELLIDEIADVGRFKRVERHISSELAKRQNQDCGR